MYCEFYQMTERPFNVTPDPKCLYLNARYREALAALHYGITQRKGFITLIGEAGTGKDLLALQERDVDLGQGFLLGRPAVAPEPPRRIRAIRELLFNAVNMVVEVNPRDIAQIEGDKRFNLYPFFFGFRDEQGEKGFLMIAVKKRPELPIDIPPEGKPEREPDIQPFDRISDIHDLGTP